MTAQMVIRIDEGLKDNVNSIAKMEGKSTTQVVRNLLEEYVRNRDLGKYVDSLWARMGKNLDPRGADSTYLNQIIKDVRKEQHGKSCN